MPFVPKNHWAQDGTLTVEQIFVTQEQLDHFERTEFARATLRRILRQGLDDLGIADIPTTKLDWQAFRTALDAKTFTAGQVQGYIRHLVLFSFLMHVALLGDAPR